jgi:hypothetical protein
MNIEEACKKWVGRDFSSIPTQLIKRAYKDDYYDLELLTSEEPVYDYPAAWGWMFHPDDTTDQRWIKENLQDVEDCGFLVYESDECGILLAIDGAGYDFYENHWIPLYKARGLKWHQIE